MLHIGAQLIGKQEHERLVIHRGHSTCLRKDCDGEGPHNGHRNYNDGQFVVVLEDPEGQSVLPFRTRFVSEVDPKATEEINGVN